MEHSPEFSFTGLDGRPLDLSKTRQKKGVLQLIRSHMEFLGYSIERRKPRHDDEKPVFLGSHSRNNNRPRLRFLEPTPGIVLFSFHFNSSAKVSLETGKFFNKANKEMYLLKVYYEVSDDGNMSFCFEGVYCGEYSKSAFSHFHDTVQTDLRCFRNFEGHDAVIFGNEDAQDGNKEDK